MHADTLLSNARIYTQYHQQPWARAVAVRGGKVLALFDDPHPTDVIAPGGEEIDLGGKLVIPGLVDAHVHLSWYATSLFEADLRSTTSMEEAAQRAAARATDETWVQGRGWAQDDWENPIFPTAAALDAVIPDKPVFLVARSGHAAWANSKALQMVGITAETPDPPGGEIRRDDSGQPTGVLFETAMDLVRDHIPSPTPDQLAARVQTAIERAHRGGLTGIHDFDGALALRSYQVLHQRRDLTLRILKNIPVALLDHAIAVGLRWGFGDDMLRIGGVKTFADGALGARTAWMIDPYEGEPDNYGICVTDPEEMFHNVRRASLAGLPSTIHAIGDKAVHEVLNVYEAVRRDEAEHGIPRGQRRHRIEHVQVIHPEDRHRLAQLGVIASMQPNHATSDMEIAEKYWGERSANAYNWRAQLDESAVLALGSDAPIEPIEPLPNIQAAVTRRRPDGSPGPEGWRARNGKGRLTVQEAIHGFTRGPAYTAGLEDRLGQLEPGMLADLVVLGQDIFTADPMTIGETPVLGTMVGGGWVHRTF